MRRLVYASSSSAYGDVKSFPQREDFKTNPISPYGVSKLAGENYCCTFAATFGLETVSLRYFNVFGRRQDPESKYSACIPALLSRMLRDKPPIVEWDGKTESKKRVRLVVGVEQDEMSEEDVVNGLRFRQRVEILLKQMQRRVNLSAFGGGKAHVRPAKLEKPDEEERRKIVKNCRQVATRRTNDQARLKAVEQELEQLRAGQSTTNKLELGIRDLKKLVQDLQRRIQRSTARLEELDSLLDWANGKGTRPEEKQVAELDLTRDSVLTQLRLEVFTAQKTLLDDFIEQALKPMLREEAEQQAADRQQRDARSTAKEREGEPLSTDAEELYQIKLNNLERETILERLTNQRGEFVRHKTKRIILVVFDRCEERRIQAAFERYCIILNQRDVRIPMDDGKPWRLLFTYHLDAPSSSAQFK